MKTKPLQKILITVCCMLLWNLSQATNGIAVRLLGYTIDSTLNVSIGYKLTISAEVTNTDSQQVFFDRLDFGMRNLQQDLSASSVFNKPVYSTDSVYLDPFETVPAIFSIDIDHPYFTPGPDVVVVWPISPNPIADSIRIPLNILNPNGMLKNEDLPFSYLVTNSDITLMNIDNKNSFKQVRIFNLMGQLVSSLQSDFITRIPIPDLPKGIYLCQLMSNGKTVTLKFLH